MRLDWTSLLMPVVLISLVSFVSSMSVAQTLALRHGQRIDSDRELLGLGLAMWAVPKWQCRVFVSPVVNDAAGARSPWQGWSPCHAGHFVVVVSAVDGPSALRRWLP